MNLRSELLDAKRGGLLAGTGNQRLSDYLTSWLAQKRLEELSDRTLERYDSLIRGSISPALGHIRLCDLTAQHLADYYATSRAEASPRRSEPTGKTGKDGKPETRPAPLSPTTVHHRHTVLNAALRSAVRGGIIPSNPADRLTGTPKRGRAVLHMIDEAEAWRVMEALADSNIDTLARVALYTGARLGELLALRWRDLDLDRQVMHVRRTVVEHMKAIEGRDWYDFKEPKSHKGRSVDLDEATVELLRRCKREQAEERLALGAAWQPLDLVFTWRGGEPVRPSTVSRRFRQLTTDAHLDGIRFHDLRHAHATMMLRAGVAAHVVSRRLGHSDVAITLRVYADVLPGQERAAVDTFAASLQRAHEGR